MTREETWLRALSDRCAQLNREELEGSLHERLHELEREKGATVHSYLDCSSLHLTEATRDALDGGIVYATMRGDFGWFVFAGERDDPPKVPDDLAAVLARARELGCTYVLVDVDAPLVAGLEVYDGA